MIDDNGLGAAAKAIRRVIEMRNNSLCYSGDALLDERSWPTETEFARAAITAYLSASAEPVAWVVMANGKPLFVGLDEHITRAYSNRYPTVPLYTHPKEPPDA